MSIKMEIFMSKDFTNFIVEWEMNLFHDYYRSVDVKILRTYYNT